MPTELKGYAIQIRESDRVKPFAWIVFDPTVQMSCPSPIGDGDAETLDTAFTDARRVVESQPDPES